jgi:cation diffusion facilitator CzcD-associated flavoprotein CzcO
MHSHEYREPCRFKDKTVACVGAGPSGIDIGLELAEVCNTVKLHQLNSK